MTQFEEQFETLLNYWPDEDSTLRQLRIKAFNQFKDLGLPSKKWEDWQFTDFSSLEKTDYRLPWADNLPDLPSIIPGRIPNTHLILMINGHYQPQLSAIPKGVTISTGFDHFKSNPDYYAINGDLNPFFALNTSMMNSGISFIIDANNIIEKPIQVIYVMTNLSDPLMNHPRFIFQVGKNAEATIVEHYSGSSDTSYFINPVTQVTLETNAVLNHIRIQEESSTASHTASTHYTIGREGRLNSVSVSSGSKLFRHDVKLAFKSRGGYASLNGLSLTEKDQHHDQHVLLDHASDVCQSHQLFKYILSDKSSGVFNGKVIVREDTKQTDANQSNKNLLLSPTALMNSNPQLEIYSEDVKCAHGSTTGQIDPEALFYLRTRGIGIHKAMELIIGGFSKDIIDKINNEDVKSYIDKKVTDWLEGAVQHG